MVRGKRAHEGAKLFLRGRWYGADFRKYGGPRQTLRNPNNPGWPATGERTEDREIAARWTWAYVDYYREGTKRRLLGLPEPRRLGEAIDQYIAERELSHAANTVKNDLTFLAHLRRWCGEDVYVHDITKDKLQALLNDFIRGDYKPTTMQTMRVVLSGFFNWAGKHNPASNAVTPDIPKADIFTWSDEQIERIRDAADWVERDNWHPDCIPGVPIRKAIELALATGCRAQELFALQWSDIDQQTKTVRIVRQLVRDTERTKGLKGKDMRTAVILPNWWPYHERGSGWVLQRPDGKPINANLSRRLVNRVLVRAKLKAPGQGVGRGWHDFRRTYGRIFLEMGGWMDELQRSLGHKSIRVTEASYGKFQGEVAAQFATARIYGEGRLRAMR